MWRDPVIWSGITQGVLLLLLVVCAVTDLVYSKIYNKVTVTAMVCGVVTNTLASGLDGLKTSLVGLVLGFGLFLIVYMFGGMGGGDVKLMGAIGALGGYPFILWAVFFSALSGGLIAILIMMYHGRLWRGFKNVFRALFTCIMPHRVTEPLDPSDSMKIPFGFGISIGTLWCWILSILGKI
ncbi:prepilin peptidase [bacterium]|nr:prepilin peptidase [candidate division CSSED10-310 bacterium]